MKPTIMKITGGLVIVLGIITGFTVITKTGADMEKLRDNQLKEIESLVQFRDQKDSNISEADVEWHLDHMLKVINRIYDSLEKSDPEEFSWSPNPLKALVFFTGTMKRGVGKSPDSVRPPANISTTDIEDQIEEAKSKLMQFDDLHEKSHFYHYAFGTLDLQDAKRFVEIHTDHHLKIIRDILKEEAL